ncbi:Transducin/WD40 repeat-like superfamily protein, putative isoform 2 [Hibiscus syriacus]|uniref:Transducin/WD40 repeat-like superfamily protein, putative isoform 2 n=1 Tax=Hibiscus syriacus TaxID=106335 RepID=A0A6A2Z217_HIBSY|nr:Transducin/WD40 repeat-like superfamily protein, putative isoform 2 [Hibiscus syriacus]
MNSDSSLELSRGNKPTENTLSSSISVSYISSSSYGSAPMLSHPKKSASSEVCFISESVVSGTESKPSTLLPGSSAENTHTASPPLPLTPRLSRKSSGFRSPSGSDHVNDSTLDHSVGHKVDMVQENMVEMPYSGDHLQKGEDVAQNGISSVPDPRAVFKHSTHLGETTVQDVVKNDAERIEVDDEVLGETRFSQTNETKYQQGSHTIVTDNKEKVFYSQASDLGIQTAREFCVESYGVEGAQQANPIGVSVQVDGLSNAGDGDDHNLIKDSSPKVGETDTAVAVSLSPASSKGKKKKKTSQSHSVQKQMNAIVSAQFNKEGKRLEASLVRSIEKAIKANTDALWARFQDENARQEKKQLQFGPVVARAIVPTLEKSIFSAITESFQKGVGEKTVNHFAKSVSSKLEVTLARQIQAQFQISGKQALQDVLRSSLDTCVIPAFEMSCKSMYEQIDVIFQKGLREHTAAERQQFEKSHSPVVAALQDAINSAASITQTLSGELANGQQKLIAMAASGANSNAGNPLVTQSSNGPLAHLHEMYQPEAHMDPMKELGRKIAEKKYDEAFTAAMHRSDVSIVSWLCSQVS